jgi:hypothetical protein
MVERRVYNTNAESKVMQGMRRRKVRGRYKVEILETRGIHTLADTGPLGQLWKRHVDQYHVEEAT